MSTICIFGNSHLGALAQAPQGNARFAEAGHDLFYWGAAGGNFPRLRYEAGTVTSPHPSQARMISGGRCDALAVAETDVIVFYACHVIITNETRRLAHALKTAGTISSAMRAELQDEMIARWWQNQTIRPIIEAIRHDFPEKRLMFYVHPFEAREGGRLNGLGSVDDLRGLQETLLAHVDAWACDLEVELCPQPAETVDDGLYTDVRYARGSVKMGTDEEHPDNDFRHMNAAYGEAVLTEMLDRIETPKQV